MLVHMLVVVLVVALFVVLVVLVLLVMLLKTNASKLDIIELWCTRPMLPMIRRAPIEPVPMLS